MSSLRLWKYNTGGSMTHLARKNNALQLHYMIKCPHCPKTYRYLGAINPHIYKKFVVLILKKIFYVLTGNKSGMIYAQQIQCKIIKFFPPPSYSTFHHKHIIYTSFCSHYLYLILFFNLFLIILF